MYRVDKRGVGTELGKMIVAVGVLGHGKLGCVDRVRGEGCMDRLEKKGV